MTKYLEGVIDVAPGVKIRFENSMVFRTVSDNPQAEATVRLHDGAGLSADTDIAVGSGLTVSGTLADGDLTISIDPAIVALLAGTAPFSTEQVVDVEDAVTAARTILLALVHHSSGVAAANFGGELVMQAELSDGTVATQGTVATAWVSATAGAQTARILFLVSDSGARREAMRMQASGAAPMLGFFGVAAVVRPTALTAASAAAINSGDATTDTVIANMRTRINELETKLQSLGLLT